MAIVLVGSMLALSRGVVVPTRAAIFATTVCATNRDCTLPEICCDGIFFNYCCDIGARGGLLVPRNRTALAL